MLLEGRAASYVDRIRSGIPIFGAGLQTVLLLLVLGCPRTSSGPGPCTQDAQCELGFTCVTGACRCRNDEACPEYSFCNRAGQCQTNPICKSNADCTNGTHCDQNTGGCISNAQCGHDVQCSPGFLCIEDTCVPGCTEDAHCALTSICEPAPGHGLGECVPNRCRSNAACALGSRCVGERCYPSPNTTHCKDCSDQDCPGARDYCLISTAFDPTQQAEPERFCGIDCADNAGLCPNGYACQDVVVLTSAPCTQDPDCNGGGRICAKPEGHSTGLCTCVQDLDCATEVVRAQCTGFGLCLFPAGRLCGDNLDCETIPVCGPYGEGSRNVCFYEPSKTCRTNRECLCVQGECVNTGRPCDRGANCNPPCVNGGCRLGLACAPEEGLVCADLKP